MKNKGRLGQPHPGSGTEAEHHIAQSPSRVFSDRMGNNGGGLLKESDYSDKYMKKPRRESLLGGAF